MGLYIKGMRMPEDCRECHFKDYVFTTGTTWCGANCVVLARNFEAIKFDGRPDYCPLVDLGKHGDLIDRQKLIEDNKHLEYPTDGKYRRDRAWAVGFNAGAKHCNEHAVYAKAVIEAEDGT